MNTSETQWKKSSFISAAHVMHRPRSMPRHNKRLTGILRANTVNMKAEPVVIGAEQEKIQVAPIMQNGQVKALRVTCACGCESTFDIQYGAGGNTHDTQNPGNNVHTGLTDQQLHDTKDHAA